jgi:hypothetical protein
MSTRYIRSGGVAYRKIRQEHVLVPVMADMEKLDSIFSLNDVASFIWDHLSESATMDQLVQRVVSEYDVDEQVARVDTARILNELETIGAINTVGEGT